MSTDASCRAILSSPARRALAVTALSLAVWLSWVAFGTKGHAFVDLSNGNFTDHFSHMNAARLFPRVGADIWRKPVSGMLRSVSGPKLALLSPDVQAGGSSNGGVYLVPGWPPGKPMVTSWSNIPRLYPPGDMVLVSPVALAYHFTGLSARGANRALIMLFLVYAHAALYLFLRAYFEKSDGAGEVGLLTLFVVYSNSINWTLQGFYDLAAAVPLLLCAGYLRERRGLAAMTAFCAAAAIHFRAYFLVPWVLYAVYLVIRERQWRGWGRPAVVAIVAAVALAFTSLYAFYLVSPTFKGQSVNCPVHIWGAARDRAGLFAFGAVWVAAGVVFLRVRAWLDLSVLTWFAVMLTGMKEAYQWHTLIPMAWLGAPVIGARDGAVPLVRDTRMAVFLFMAIWIFRNQLIPIWLHALF